jgi:uncharacterized integral membrane protein
MIVVGFILIAAAVAAGVILIVQNRGAIDVHALGGSWHVDAYWLLVAGLVILAVAILGLAIAKTAAARVWRLRRERRELARENRRLSAQVDASTGSASPPRAASTTGEAVPPPVAADTSAAAGAEARPAKRGLHLHRTARHP